MQFVRDIKFDRLGVFAYSQEEDTPAARLPNQVPEDIKEERASQLMEIQREISKEINGRFIGQTIHVLIERYDGRNDVYIGRSQYDAPEIDGEVYVSGCKPDIGQIHPVRITHSLDFDLTGVGVTS
jgi:ribosomal protein S12 methylthiotransferase